MMTRALHDIHFTGPAIASLLGACTLALWTTSPTMADPARSAVRTYPTAPRAEVVEDYHGTKVADPYRPLEDPDSNPTRAWVEAENKITFQFLEQIPSRVPLKQR